MSPTERRQQVLETLCRRRHDTYGNLAHEFNVCKETIRHDIEELMRFYPLETVRGRYGGGVRVMDGFYLNHYHSNRAVFTPKQAALIKKMGDLLVGDDLDTLNTIISDFAP